MDRFSRKKVGKKRNQDTKYIESRYKKNHIILGLIGKSETRHYKNLLYELRERDEFHDTYTLGSLNKFLDRLSSNYQIKWLKNGSGRVRLTKSGYKKLQWLKKNNKLPPDLQEEKFVKPLPSNRYD